MLMIDWNFVYFRLAPFLGGLYGCFLVSLWKLYHLPKPSATVADLRRYMSQRRQWRMLGIISLLWALGITTVSGTAITMFLVQNGH